MEYWMWIVLLTAMLKQTINLSPMSQFFELSRQQLELDDIVSYSVEGESLRMISKNSQFMQFSEKTGTVVKKRLNENGIYGSKVDEKMVDHHTAIGFYLDTQMVFINKKPAGCAIVKISYSYTIWPKTFIKQIQNKCQYLGVYETYHNQKSNLTTSSFYTIFNPGSTILNYTVNILMQVTYRFAEDAEMQHYTRVSAELPQNLVIKDSIMYYLSYDGIVYYTNLNCITLINHQYAVNLTGLTSNQTQPPFFIINDMDTMFFIFPNGTFIHTYTLSGFYLGNSIKKLEQHTLNIINACINKNGDVLYLIQLKEVMDISLFVYYFSKYALESDVDNPSILTTHEIGHFQVTLNSRIVLSNFNQDIPSHVVLVQQNNLLALCDFQSQSCYDEFGNPLSHSNTYNVTRGTVFGATFANYSHIAVLEKAQNQTIVTYFSSDAYISETESIMFQNEPWPYGFIGSLNDTQNGSVQPTIGSQPIDIIQKTDQQVQEDIIVSSSTKSLTTVMSFPNAKQVFKIFNPLFMFMEDYWFYTYHKRQYSSTMNKTFQLIRAINQAKIVPTFLEKITNTMQKTIEFSKYFDSNFTVYTPQKFKEKQKSDINFMKNAQEVFIWNFFYSFLFFFAFKLIAKLPFVKFKNTQITKFIKQKTHNSVIFLITIENNLQFFSFMCFSQLTITAQYDFSDKIKLILCVLVLFCVVLYSIGGYYILRSVYNHQIWSIYLEYKKLIRLSFSLSTIMFSLRALLMGFCHGFLQNSPAIQSKVIIGADFLSVVTHCICWKAQKSKVSCFLLFFYYVVRLSFDILILNEISINTKTEYLEAYHIGCLILIIIFIFFWNIFCLTKNWLIDFSNNSKDSFDRPKMSKKDKLKSNADINTKKTLFSQKDLPGQEQCPQFSHKTIEIAPSSSKISKAMTYLFIDPSLLSDIEDQQIQNENKADKNSDKKGKNRVQQVKKIDRKNVKQKNKTKSIKNEQKQKKDKKRYEQDQFEKALQEQLDLSYYKMGNTGKSVKAVIKTYKQM